MNFISKLEGGLGKPFQRLWVASVVSDLGDGVRLTALPLLATQITRDPLLISGIMVAEGLPWLAFTLFAGVWIDRVDRRKLMARVQFIRMAVVLVLALSLIWVLVPIWVIYVTALVLTTCDVAFATAAPAILPRLVGREDLSRANSRLFGGQMLANEFAGPPIGALLLSLARPLPFILDSASFLVGWILIRALPGDFVPDRTEGVGSVRSDMAAGFRWFLANRGMRALALTVTIGNLSRAMTMSIFVLFALQTLGLSGLGFALLTTAVAIGAFGGSLIASRVIHRLGEAATVFYGSLSIGGATLLMGATENAFVVAAGSLGFGIAVACVGVVSATLRQALVPDAILGRVSSIARLLTWGSLPIGALIGGIIAEYFGLRAPILAGGVLVVVATICLSRAIQELNLDDTTPQREQ